MSTSFEVMGQNTKAPFSLRIHRSEGMALLAMNWRRGRPPHSFVGFAIEYAAPGSNKFLSLHNRLAFPLADGSVDKSRPPTREAPIQMFRWVHFPWNADQAGEFVYRVTPVFMDDHDKLSYGEPQEAALELRRETYPDRLNVTFTRGFVSSQAFVDRFGDPVPTLLPDKAASGLTFKPTHKKAIEALKWMGFEARSAIIEVLDLALANKQSAVEVVAYDLNEPDVVSRLEKLGTRLRVIIDDEGAHGKSGSAETKAAALLRKSTKHTPQDPKVKRQHVGNLQHNKTIVVDGPMVKTVVCGSTNFSWRGFFVQANNAVILHGATPVKLFRAAFEAYWEHGEGTGFGATPPASLTDLELPDIDARVAFSPHRRNTALLNQIASDISSNSKSSVLYSLAFLFQTRGAIRDAIKTVTNNPKIFVYGISDHAVKGLEVQDPNGNVAPVFPGALADDVPEPFKSEPTGGTGNRMHHKFVVIDFDKPTARVYLGSYNFSGPADTQNGENLLFIRDRRVAVAYTVEAVRIFDHYTFRDRQQTADAEKKPMVLAKPPRAPGEVPWWEKFYTEPHKVRDRKMFS
jgi:phosphatidylserine/phosphatidylglycerophosphate/cardiolipin synthase-like enzyme